MPSNSPPSQNFKNRTFLARLGFALAGIAHALRSERSFRTQITFFAAVLLLMGYLRPAPVWWALIIIASCLVLALELMNTALERLTDHLHPQQHPHIAQVKDCAAAAVLCATLGAIGVAVALAAEMLWHAQP